jgi:hypothetical protein
MVGLEITIDYEDDTASLSVHGVAPTMFGAPRVNNANDGFLIAEFLKQYISRETLDDVLRRLTGDDSKSPF